MSEDQTKVVFRTFKKDGDVIALFPNEQWQGSMCSSYMHVGQHGGADYSGLIDITRPSTEEEIAPLKKELEDRGYELLVRKKRTSWKW